MQPYNTGFTFKFITRSNIYLKFHLEKKMLTQIGKTGKLASDPVLLTHEVCSWALFLCVGC